MSAQAGLFVLECNPDPAIPRDGSGCNLSRLQTPSTNADGSLSPVTLTIVTPGPVGTSSLSGCPPSSTQVAEAVASDNAHGAVTCDVAAATGPTDPTPIAAGITFEGETAMLPANFVPSIPAGSASRSGTSVAATSASAAPAGTSGGMLAFTGARIWWLVLLGGALVDLGYLLWSATWRRGLLAALVGPEPTPGTPPGRR